MVISLEVLDAPDKDWDKRVIDNEGAVYQTAAYALYLERALGMKNTFLIAKKANKIVGQLVFSSGPRFSKYLYGSHSVLYRLFLKYFKTYTFIKGPVIMEQSFKKEIYSVFLDYLDSIAKKEAFMVHDLSLPINESEQVHSLFKEKGFYRDEWGTFLIDVTQSEEVLWKNLSKTRRNLIRRGLAQGITVKEAKTKEDYELVIDIIEDMSKRNKVFAHPRTYYHTLFTILSKTGNIKTFFIEKESKGIATISVYLCGKQATQTLVAHSNQSLVDKISGTDLLEWHIIKWAHDNGYKTYDLAGIRPSSNDSKDISLREYKSKWGGQEIHYPYFSKVYSKNKGKLIDLARRLYKKKRQILLTKEKKPKESKETLLSEKISEENSKE